MQKPAQWSWGGMGWHGTTHRGRGQEVSRRENTKSSSKSPMTAICPYCKQWQRTSTEDMTDAGNSCCSALHWGLTCKPLLTQIFSRYVGGGNRMKMLASPRDSRPAQEQGQGHAPTRPQSKKIGETAVQGQNAPQQQQQHRHRTALQAPKASATHYATVLLSALPQVHVVQHMLNTISHSSNPVQLQGWPATPGDCDRHQLLTASSVLQVPALPLQLFANARNISYRRPREAERGG